MRKELWYHIRNWRIERTQAHERGDQTPELCYPNEPIEQHTFPTEIEEGGLVDPFPHTPHRLIEQYPEAQGQEIELYLNEKRS